MNIENIARFKKTYPHILTQKVGDAEYLVDATDQKLLEPFGEIIIEKAVSPAKLASSAEKPGIKSEGVPGPDTLPDFEAPDFNGTFKSFVDTVCKTQFSNIEKVFLQTRQSLASKVQSIEQEYQTKLAQLEQDFEQRLQTLIAEKVGLLNAKMDQIVSKQVSDRSELQKKIDGLSDELLVRVADDVNKCQENCCTLKDRIAIEISRIDDEYKKIVLAQNGQSNYIVALQNESKETKEDFAKLVNSLRNLPLPK